VLLESTEAMLDLLGQAAGAGLVAASLRPIQFQVAGFSGSRSAADDEVVCR
jgi:hypothetical protein